MKMLTFIRSSALRLILLFCLVVVPVGANAAEEGPRGGKYLIQSFGAPSNPPLYLGYIVLGAGTYKSFLPGDKPNGEGQFQYDPAAKKVIWTSGPFVGQWEGAFTVEREGK